MIGRCASVGLLLLGLALSASADGDSTLLPAIPPASKGEQCVEPVDVMRREHMRFLRHQRDDTVHAGIRGAKHSLVGCIDCHAQRDSLGAVIPVNAEGQFCASCHRFAGVRMDCFECHATVPPVDEANALIPEWLESSAVSVATAAP